MDSGNKLQGQKQGPWSLRERKQSLEGRKGEGAGMFQRERAHTGSSVLRGFVCFPKAGFQGTSLGGALQGKWRQSGFLTQVSGQLREAVSHNLDNGPDKQCSHSLEWAHMCSMKLCCTRSIGILLALSLVLKQVETPCWVPCKGTGDIQCAMQRHAGRHVAYSMRGSPTHE